MDYFNIISDNWQTVNGAIAGLSGGLMAWLLGKEKRTVREAFALLFGGMVCAIYAGGAVCSYFGMSQEVCLFAKFGFGVTASSIIAGMMWIGGEFKRKPGEFIKKFILNSDGSNSKVRKDRD